MQTIIDRLKGKRERPDHLSHDEKTEGVFLRTNEAISQS